jgi:PE-PPE domain/PE family
MTEQHPGVKGTPMTSLLMQPQLVETAAADLAEIRSEISEAKAAAAGPTTGVVAAAQDEVSAAAAKLFGGYAQDYQAVLAQAAAFHEEFAAVLASAGSAYASAEAANASVIAAVQPTLQGTTIGLFMGGSADPIPPPSYVTAMLNYVNHNFNVLPSNAFALFTPEGYYPLVLKSLPLTPSISQGVQILDSAIKTTLAANPSGSVAVLGLSQSSDISSLEMINLANPTLNPNPPTANQLGFTLTGNQMNPNGGFFARFPGFPAGQPLQFPALGLTLYGATPSNTIYPTNIFSIEYDGWADFPQYPINFVSDLNAVLGIAFVHGTYPSLNPSALPNGYDLVQLATSPGYYTNGGVTNYYMITTPNGLPLLDPLRLIPGIGNPLADLLQPDLTTIVNLGYGNPNFGYSTGPADVQTYFGLFPHYSQALIAQDLIAGAHQGTAAFVSDIHAEAAGVSLSSVSHSLTSMAGTGAADVHALTHTLSSSSPASIIADIQGAVTNTVNEISGTAANLYGALLPTADIVNTLITVMPAYDVNLFLSGIQQAIDGNVLGGLQYALVAPIAANTAFVTLASLIELDVILNAFGLSL